MTMWNHEELLQHTGKNINIYKEKKDIYYQDNIHTANNNFFVNDPK